MPRSRLRLLAFLPPIAGAAWLLADSIFRPQPTASRPAPLASPAPAAPAPAQAAAAAVRSGPARCGPPERPKEAKAGEDFTVAGAPNERLRPGNCSCCWELRPTDWNTGDGPEECRFTLRRRRAADGGEVDLMTYPHTAAALGVLPAAERSWWDGDGTSRVSVCGTRAGLDVCMACGHSCNQFGFMYTRDVKQHFPETVYPASVGRPPLVVGVGPYLRPKKGDRKGTSRHCFVRCGNLLEGARSDIGIWAGMGRFRRPPLYVYGADANVYGFATAGRLGFNVIKAQGNLSLSSCRTVIREPTVFYGILEWQILPSRNVGHWYHDAFWPLLMNLHNHGLLEPPPGGGGGVRYRVASQGAHFRPYLERGMGWLLEDLATAGGAERVEIQAGTCFLHAIFDCPKAASMGPVRPAQDWLTKRHGFSFTPLPARPPTRLRLSLLVRRKGGTRYLSNWAELLRAAEAEDFEATVLNGTQQVHPEALRKEIIPALQRSHVVAGMHGAELSLMPVVPNGSVVIEIIPTRFRFLDPWYVRQAGAAGLHLVRWAPSPSAATWGNITTHEGAVTSGVHGEEHAAVWRLRSSSFSVSLPAWRELLRRAAVLLRSNGGG